MILISLLFLFITSSFVEAQELTTRITDGVYTFNLGNLELPYTSMFVVTGSGVMVIDPMNSNNARAMLQEIRKITNEPIRYVFYSHDHWDHASGGQVFKNEGAEIIAHEEANNWIKENANPDQIPATTEWFGSRKQYSLGRFTMELYNFGPSHGDGMTVFVVNSQPKVAYLADIASIKSVGPFFLPDFDTKGWEETLEKTLQLDFQNVIFAHSPQQGGTRQDLEDQLGYIKDVRAAVRAELGKGTNPFAIPSVIKLDKYKDWNGYNDQFILNLQHFVVEEGILGPYARPGRRKRSSQSTKSFNQGQSFGSGYSYWRLRSCKGRY